MKTIKLLAALAICGIPLIPMLAMDNKQQKEHALLDEFKRAINQDEIPVEWMLKQLRGLDKKGLSENKLKRIETRQVICIQEMDERQRYQDSIKSQYEQLKN